MSRFTKPPLTPQEQLALLQSRGLHIQDPERALRLLEVTTLFRLSPYMRPFQRPESPEHHFKPGAQLNEIVRVYEFDSQLRQLVMAAIERVEVAIRATISNWMAPKYGTHWYMEPAHFNSFYNHAKLLRTIRGKLTAEQQKFERECRAIQNSHASSETRAARIEARKRDNYPRFYAETYTEPELPPTWSLVEELSLGEISHLYKGLSQDKDRKGIARRFGIQQKVLGSWLHTLTFVRNICAHHSRLWNRELSVPPRWDDRVPTPDGRSRRDVPRRLFTVVFILVVLSDRLSPDTEFSTRIKKLLENDPAIPRHPMGFPDDWENRLDELARFTGKEA